MVTIEEAKARLRQNFPRINALTQGQRRWWSKEAPLRWWLSFDGYTDFLKTLESKLSELKNDIPQFYGKLTKNLLDPQNFWGHASEVYLTSWLRDQSIIITDVEREFPYNGKHHKPDFVVTYDGDCGVIEAKTLSPSLATWEKTNVSDCLTYLLNDITASLPIGLDLEAVLDDWATLNTFQDEVFDLVKNISNWQTGTNFSLSSATLKTRERYLPSGYPDWQRLGQSGFLDPNIANLQKLYDELSYKKEQVHGHGGYNCIFVDISWDPWLSMKTLWHHWPIQWFQNDDREGIVNAIFTTGIDRLTGRLVTPIYWRNPCARVPQGKLGSKLAKGSWMAM